MNQINGFRLGCFLSAGGVTLQLEFIMKNTPNEKREIFIAPLR
jgi:uncharacterized protein YfaP (DUF2135 family)